MISGWWPSTCIYLSSFSRISHYKMYLGPLFPLQWHNFIQLSGFSEIRCVFSMIYRWGISGAEMISASRRGSVADSAVRRTREIPRAAAVLWLIPPSAANAKFRQPPWICGWFRRPPRICGWFRRPPHTRNSASRRARMVGKDGLS